MRKKIKKRALLGLSGGVDSAVAALLLKKEGYEVIGAFIKCFSDTKNKITGQCSWVEEYAMAKKIAALLEIPLVKYDFEREYKKYVIDPLFKDYKRGITPNPDIACNTLIKFPLLWKAAQKTGAQFIATGHYARIKRTPQGYELHQGFDTTKDQSYFLYELSQSELAHTLVPIGNLTKDQVRAIAKKHRFPNYDKISSRGICFVGNIPLKTFLQQRLKEKRGKVLNKEGEVIGVHKGAHYYTIGERARPTIGIQYTKGIHAQERYFVARKNIRINTITVVPQGDASLYKRKFSIIRVHGLDKEEKKVQARIRHLGELMPARLTIKEKKVQCVLARPTQGLAPGQSAVFYKGSKLLGGGIISATES